MGKHAVLFGGGLDSSAVLSRLANAQGAADGDGLQSILVIHVDYGQKAVVSEREAALKQIAYYGIPNELVTLKMDMTYSGAAIMPNTNLGTDVAKNNVLELRNPSLMMLAASYLSSVYPGLQHFLYIGLHREPKDTAFRDAVHYFYVDRLNGVINILLGGKSSVLIRAPFKNGSRTSILRKLVAARGVDFVRDYVHTCYEEVACGTCTHCVKLENMLNEIGETSNV